MAVTGLNRYIEKRYQRWLDYSRYHCQQAVLPGQEMDLLDEVILSLLQMNEAKLIRLLNTKKGQYRDLDFFVLRMIKLNAYSPTAPYRAKYKPIRADSNVNPDRLDIIDETESGEDTPRRILEQFNQVREVFVSLNISDKARRIFEYKFFQDQSFSNWPGPESRKELYGTYAQMIKLIKEKINGKTLL